MSLIAPAQDFLSSISLSKKLTLIILIVLAPGLTSIGLISYMKNEQVDAYSSAAQGVEVTSLKNQIVNSIGSHRDLMNQYANGHSQLKQNIITNEANTDLLLSKLENLFSEQPVLKEKLQGYKKDWHKLKINRFEPSAQNSFEAHTNMIVALNHIHFYTKSSYFQGVKEINLLNSLDLLGDNLSNFSDLVDQTKTLSTEIALAGKFSPNSFIAINASILKVEKELDLLNSFNQASNQHTVDLSDLKQETTKYLTFIKEKMIEPSSIQTTNNEVYNLGASLLKTISAKELLIQKNLVSDIQTASHHAKQTQRLVLSFFALATLLSGYLFYAFYEATMKSVQNVKKASYNMANGDLSQQIPVTTNDELGEICTAINNMGIIFSSIIKETQNTVMEVTSQASVIDSLSKEADQDMLTQQSQLDMAASAMTEMSCSAQEVRGSTENTSHSAGSAEQQAFNADQVAREAVGEIDTLVQQIEQTSTAINKLADDANNIGTVTDVIRGIAEQTNLLALNAAIEAARAGEQGRGFAVVADEVRTLAQRTRESTDEIQSMISKLQAASSKVVDIIQHSKTSVEQSSEKVSQTLDALNVINGAVGEINMMSSQIASAATQQATSSETLSNNIAETHQLSSKAVKLTSEISKASGDLNAASEKLYNKLMNYKTA